MSGSEADREALRTVVLDLTSITLGEMAAMEEQSGRDFTALLKSGTATRRLMALWLSESRSSEKPRSWRELSNLRPLGEPSSPSPSEPAGRRSRASD